MFSLLFHSFINSNKHSPQPLIFTIRLSDFYDADKNYLKKICIENPCGEYFIGLGSLLNINEVIYILLRNSIYNSFSSQQGYFVQNEKISFKNAI